MKKGTSISLIIIILMAVVIIAGISESLTETVINNVYQKGEIKIKSNSIRIISSQENEPLEDIIMNYADSKGYNVQIDYDGTIDIIQKLNSGEKYDAVWLSNSIWGYMLDSSVTLSNSKCTSINPVVFGIKKSKAQELGFVGKTIYTKDIVNAIANGKLKFSMSNPTSTNSGASAYLGMLSTLAGNPEVLTRENLNDENLKNQLKTLFTGMQRSSGNEDFLEEMFLKSDYEAVMTYESSIININQKLQAQGKETLYAIYPVDGVSISDSPIAYIDNKDESKKEIFKDIQSYILSDEGQALLQKQGKRTWYGGTTTNADKSIFNPEWGIDTSKYISPIKYPSTEVIKLALKLYQNELRKPVHVVFCLDYSGSMYGAGEKELKSAMDYILTEKAANDFIQFAEGDKIDVIPFASEVEGVWSTQNGVDTTELLKNINSMEPNGMTALYPAAQKAIELLANEDGEKYNLSVVLMTDGLGNRGTYSELRNRYYQLKKNIPIYSIMFGSADEAQLEQIANMTNAKVFDGKSDLVKAFKQVRGYN